MFVLSHGNTRALLSYYFTDTASSIHHVIHVIRAEAREGICLLVLGGFLFDKFSPIFPSWIWKLRGRKNGTEREGEWKARKKGRNADGGKKWKSGRVENWKGEQRREWMFLLSILSIYWFWPWLALHCKATFVCILLSPSKTIIFFTSVGWITYCTTLYCCFKMHIVTNVHAVKAEYLNNIRNTTRYSF